MGEHKGVITIIIAVLVLFGLFVAFGTNVIGPLLQTIGDNFSTMVNNVFSGTQGGSYANPNGVITAPGN